MALFIYIEDNIFSVHMASNLYGVIVRPPPPKGALRAPLGGGAHTYTISFMV